MAYAILLFAVSGGRGFLLAHTLGGLYPSKE